jgi:Tfp pilus assembly protein PilF
MPLFALLLLLPAGCVGLPSRAPEPEPSPLVLELPPAQAAEVSLATARELDRVGNEAEAIAEYEKARRLNPKLTQVSRRLAVLYDRQGDASRAQAEYRLALDQAPNDADLLNDVGYFHYQRGDWTEAEKCLRQAVARKPDHTRAWGNLGLVLGRQERYPESYEAFVRVMPPGEARANVGILQAQQGQVEEARESLRQALTLAPELRSARAILLRVEEQRPEDSARLTAPNEKGPDTRRAEVPDERP